jgi:hypothetical protein
MRKPLRLLITLGSGVAIAAAVVLLFGRLPLLGEERVPAQDATLVNGGFEGTYELWEGSVDRKVAPGWSLWYQEEGSAYPPPKTEDRSDHRREGAKSQFMFGRDRWSGYHGCIYQQVGGLVENHYIRFSAWAKADPDPELDSPEKWRTMVGIDPSGGTNPQDINHYDYPDLWDMYTDRGQWQHLSVVMRATSPTATVYACAHPGLSRPLYVWWDDASFVMTEGSLVYAPVVAKDLFQVPLGTLANPDLEKVWGRYDDYYVPIPGFGNVKVAPYWYPYWNTNYISETSENKQPEYGPTGLGAGYPYRSHSGEWAQQMGSSGGGAFEAGIYQVVRGVQPGDTYSFTMWAHGWTQYWPSESDPADERVSDYQEPDGLQFKIGIDPYGGESYTSTQIIWSEKQDPYDEWYQFEVTATAMARQISVWAYAHPTNYLLRWNETFWDDASLQIVESP